MILFPETIWKSRTHERGMDQHRVQPIPANPCRVSRQTRQAHSATRSQWSLHPLWL